jgi:hypothetical protein
MVSGNFIDSLKSPQVSLPELPEPRAFDILSQIEDYERQILGVKSSVISKEDYGLGSATSPDELLVVEGELLRPLLTAEHATNPVRKKTGLREGADTGTGGLAFALANNEAATAVIPLGDQTGNAGVDLDHPIKTRTGELLVEKVPSGYLSIHGMIPGKLLHETDETEIQALIGLGRSPTDATREYAEKLVSTAKDVGIRAVISNDNYHQKIDLDTGRVVLDDEGRPVLGRLAALGEGSMTNFVQARLANPAIQLELTRGLRLIPDDLENGWHHDRTARAMGVYTGYVLCKAAIDLLVAE